MDHKMTIACLQMPVIWGEEQANVQMVVRAIDQISIDQPGVICLPELFTTGFNYTYLKGRNPEMTWSILDQLAKKASEKRIYILAGTLPETDGKLVYNTLFVLDPSGKKAAMYRKIHLFPLMGEDNFFSPGKHPLVFQTPWAKIGVAICYDLRFSDLFQSMAKDGAEIMIVVAQFPIARIDHWDILLKARAIENQVFVAGINRIGEDPSNTFPGHTCILDPMGKLIAGGGEEEGWISASIDIKDVERTRQKLPALFYEKR